MGEVVLSVRRDAVEWALTSNLALHPLYFRSGGRAELTARGLATRRANANIPVQLLVADGAHAVVAVPWYGPRRLALDFASVRA